MTERLSQQLAFILEIDRLKSVCRRSYLLDGARLENSAEHSWHVALMALVLAEHAAEPVDATRAMKLLLVHDLVEIDCGDTYCYDAVAVASQPEREARAAARLFGLLPPDQAAELAGLWHEFEARATPEARFAHAVDRLMPMLHNYHTGGRAWVEHDVHQDQVLRRAAGIADGAPELYEYAQQLVASAVEQGWLRAEDGGR
jgi:putative hydrolase of HD superfamily